MTLFHLDRLVHEGLARRSQGRLRYLYLLTLHGPMRKVPYLLLPSVHEQIHRRESPQQQIGIYRL